MSNAALYFISPLVRHVERSRMYIPQTFLDRCCWSQVLCCWSQVLFFWIMSLCPSLSLNFFLKNQLCSRTTLLRLVSVLSSMLRWSCKYQREGSEYWEQKVLSVFTCSCHQRKLCQPLFAVTHEDTHIDHLDQWNENNRSCDPISIDQLETRAYLISCALREHFPGCWDMGQRYESSANLSRSQETSRRYGFIVYSFIVALGWILAIY